LEHDISDVCCLHCNYQISLYSSIKFLQCMIKILYFFDLLNTDNCPDWNVNYIVNMFFFFFVYGKTKLDALLVFLTTCFKQSDSCRINCSFSLILDADFDNSLWIFS
jgi:hypothetical protein